MVSEEKKKDDNYSWKQIADRNVLRCVYTIKQYTISQGKKGQNSFQSKNIYIYVYWQLFLQYEIKMYGDQGYTS